MNVKEFIRSVTMHNDASLRLRLRKINYRAIVLNWNRRCHVTRGHVAFLSGRSSIDQSQRAVAGVLSASVPSANQLQSNSIQLFMSLISTHTGLFHHAMTSTQDFLIYMTVVEISATFFSKNHFENLIKQTFDWQFNQK